MILPDVNVLLYAHRIDAPDHAAYAAWLTRLVTSPEPFALSELVLAGFLRVATNPRAFRDPSTLDQALGFVEQLVQRPQCRLLRPGPRHFELFVALCRQADATGGLVADAYHAALAREHGCEWATSDGDFARFAGLRWRHPLAG